MRVGMYVPAMCVCVITHIACVLCFAQFVLLVLMPSSERARPGLDFIPVLFRYVVRPLRKLLFCLMICAQSRN